MIVAESSEQAAAPDQDVHRRVCCVHRIRGRAHDLGRRRARRRRRSRAFRPGARARAEREHDHRADGEHPHRSHDFHESGHPRAANVLNSPLISASCAAASKSTGIGCMHLRNTETRYGVVAQLFHWIIVALIITQFVLANKAEALPLGLAKLAVLAQHKSVGMTIFGLAVLRLAWRWLNPVPASPSDTPAW